MCKRNMEYITKLKLLVYICRFSCLSVLWRCLLLETGLTVFYRFLIKYTMLPSCVVCKVVYHGRHVSSGRRTESRTFTYMLSAHCILMKMVAYKSANTQQWWQQWRLQGRRRRLLSFTGKPKVGCRLIHGSVILHGFSPQKLGVDLYMDWIIHKYGINIVMAWSGLYVLTFH